MLYEPTVTKALAGQPMSSAVERSLLTTGLNLWLQTRR